MVSTRNTSRSHANPPRMQDQQGNVDSQPPGGTLETLYANTDEMEVLRLTNQRLLREVEQLTRQIQRPQGTRQAREGRNTIPQEEQQHLNPPREANGEGETSRARERDPYIPPEEDRNEGALSEKSKDNGPAPYRQGVGEQSWEQRFRDIQ